MVGTTLREIREHVESLSSDDGAYYVACGRSGVRPAPVADERFETREAAVAAARATEQYRAALRRYDPDLPFYDPIVRERIPGASADDPPELHGSIGEGERPSDGESGPDADETGGERLPADLVSFCHDVAGAVFETLSARGHETVERAVVETYLAAAEAPTDRHALCLVLLDSMARELDRHLSEAEGVDVLSRAAMRLSPADPDPNLAGRDPVETSLAFLRSRSLLRSYDVTAYAIESEGDDRDGGSAWVVTLGGYALERSDGWIPTLPIGVDLLRRAMASPVSVVRARRLDGGGWRLVVTDDRRRPSGLIGVPSEEGDR